MLISMRQIEGFDARDPDAVAPLPRFHPESSVGRDDPRWIGARHCQVKGETPVLSHWNQHRLSHTRSLARHRGYASACVLRTTKRRSWLPNEVGLENSSQPSVARDELQVRDELNGEIGHPAGQFIVIRPDLLF
jgi:hypothetical protein